MTRLTQFYFRLIWFTIKFSKLKNKKKKNKTDLTQHSIELQAFDCE